MPEFPVIDEAHERRRCNRRQALFRCANGFGALALASLVSCSRRSPSAVGGARPARAKSVIFLYMDGGPSQIDTFDPKPRLAAENGQPIKIKTPATQFQIGNRVLASPFKFARYGECGAPVSELFPQLARCVDDIAFVRSMVSDHSEHTAANYCLHTGSGLQGRPSMGSWVTYGLGSECDDLPGFVVLESGNLPLGGVDCFGNGFLPARHQGTIFRGGRHPVADLEPTEPTARLQRAKLKLVQDLNKHRRADFAESPVFDGIVDSYELAFKMQSAVPDLLDLSDESQATAALYGLDRQETETYARQCLLARRLVERGVRFVQLLMPRLPEHNRWDQHSFLADHHRSNALAVDRPIAGLLTDLKRRGLLDETLVLWGGEFGRTPMAQTNKGGVGRDHHMRAFSMFLCGGGIRPGTCYGATDELGYNVAESPVHVNDLHATMLHLLGVDHTRLTYRYQGRDFRLTDVAGRIVSEILA